MHGLKSNAQVLSKYPPNMNTLCDWLTETIVIVP